MKDHEHAYKMFWIIIVFNGAFGYGDGGIFKLLRWLRKLYQSTWGHTILYADSLKMKNNF
jgi:hypothetical protein